MKSNLKFKVNNPNQVIDLLSSGDISTVDAFILFTELESDKKQNPGKMLEDEKLEDIMRELDELIGLDKIKLLVREIQAFIEIQKRRQEENLASGPQVLHMIFKGNPGTGKTTVARLLGKMFRHMKVLQKGHTVEVERADLVGEYIGHTAQKTRDQIKKALGGILFVDEAYSLARGGEKDFGKEAIDTLVKAMEDHKDNLIVILAGYKDEMEWFLQINPGLRSRFPILMEFKDYTPEELMKIANMMVEKRQYKFNSDALLKLEKILTASVNSPNYDKMGNARMVRNIIEKSIRRQALRLMGQKRITREDLLYLKPEDITDLEV